MSSINLNTNTTPGIWDSVCTSTKSGVEWVKDGSQRLYASAGDVLSRTGKAVAEFFSNAWQTLGVWTASARDSIYAAVAHVAALPRETKIVAGVTSLVVATAAFFLGRGCGSSTPTENTESTSTQVATTETVATTVATTVTPTV